MGLVWYGHRCCSSMGFGSPIQNIGDMVVPYSVAISDRHLTQTNFRNLFSSASYSSYIPDFIRS